MRRVLAAPREAGTPATAAARDAVGRHLQSLGYHVTVQHFTFAPASLLAFPLLGAALGWLGLLLVPFLLFRSLPAWAALAFWIGGAAAAALVAAGVGLGWTPMGAGLRGDANLIAVRDGADVRRWIVAHLDTKAQGHSMAGRLVAVWAVLAASLLLTTLAVVRLGGPLPAWVTGSGAAVGVAAGLLAARGKLVGASAGARDNATGVRAALAAAAASDDPGTGVLITGAEEFGLVGSRIFASNDPGRVLGTEVVNLDTIDDQGPVYLVSHNRDGAGLARATSALLAPLGLELRLRRLPLGIFVDSAPLAQAGASAVTVGRLTWRTLRTIHTPADTAEGLSMEAADRIGRAIGRAPAGPAMN